MPPYGGNDCLYAVVRQCRIFSPLQDKSPESQCVSLFAAIQNTFRTQPVTCYVPITFPDAALIAVVPAAITYFNQSTDINPVSEMPEADLPCLFVNDS